VTASEFAFLAFGLVLGVATGAAIIEVLRARPPAPREVRLTVTPDSVPRRRSATLAESPSTGLGGDPARGGPADPSMFDLATAMRGGLVLAHAGSRTSVPDRRGPAVSLPAAERAPVAVAVVREVDPLMLILTAQTAAVAARSGSELVSVAAHPTVEAIAPLADPRIAAADPTSVATMKPALAGDGGTADDPTARPSAAARPSSDRKASNHAASGRAAKPAASDLAESPPAATGRCAEPRRVADERCTLAARLADEAADVARVLQDRRREYDAYAVRAEQATALADPRTILAEKESARLAFRVAHAGAHDPGSLEGAARIWLQAINRINSSARDATVTAGREREAAAALAMLIERLDVEADAARINAESAAEACLAARETLAACEEGQVDRAAGRLPIDAAAIAARPPLVGGPELEPAPGWPAELPAIHEPHAADAVPRILRILQGDDAALRDVVAALAGDDAEERRRWQLLLADFVGAVQARTIEAAILDFPADHPFWGSFTRDQCRDIATALASLGYRFDGLGGFADERLPSQRDLSLAIAYVGLDPMRIRVWPTEVEIPALMRGVRIAADEYVATTAGDLTLGEMVALLRGRTESLTDLWNAWGRVRPLLLAS
jgi:hypothetical protein